MRVRRQLVNTQQHLVRRNSVHGIARCYANLFQNKADTFTQSDHHELCMVAACGTTEQMKRYAVNFNKDTFRQMLATRLHHDEYTSSVIHIPFSSRKSRIRYIHLPVSYTPLHLAAQGNTNEMVCFIVRTLANQAYRISKLTTDDGRIPLTLAEKYSQSWHTLLLPTLSHTVKSPQAMISLDRVLKRYPDIHVSSQLYENLTCAIVAANETRSLFTTTASHSYTNKFPINSPLIKRAEASVNNTQIRILEEIIDSREPLSLFDMHDIVVKHATETRAGNCVEYSHVTFNKLREMKTGELVEYVECKTGDHAFNVIGRDAASDVNDSETWGYNAVICDSHNGDILWGDEIPERLKTYVRISFFGEGKKPGTGNVSTSYNPNYHKLDSTLRSY